MAITLQRLFIDCKRNYDIDLIAGEKGMKNLVRWVHIVEDTDVPSFLHGNELVFTTGIGIASYSEFDFVRFAQSLIESTASGWVLNIGPYIKSVPKDLIDFCNQNNFPLFTIPWKMRLIDVTYDYSHKIIENEEKLSSLSRSFNNLIFNIGNVEENIDVLISGGYKPADNYQILASKLIDGNNILTSDTLNEYLYSLEASISTTVKYSILTENDMLILLLANASENDGLSIISQIKKVFKEIYKEIKIYTGISDKTIGLLNLEKLFKQALVASNAARLQKIETLTYKESGLYQLINITDDIEAKKRYVRDTLGPIIDYDKLNGTNYLEILKLYLSYNYAVLEISELLKVHRNTINYKIKFIKNHFNLELDIKEASKYWVAFMIKEFLENN